MVIAMISLVSLYGAHDALHEVTFGVRHGEVVALLGPNGAGKTTTIEILEGFRTPSADRARGLEADPALADERWRARVGVVLRSWRDHGKWRVRELLAHLGSYHAPYATGDIGDIGDIGDLRIHHASLEETYMALVRDGRPAPHRAKGAVR